MMYVRKLMKDKNESYYKIDLSKAYIVSKFKNFEMFAAYVEKEFWEAESITIQFSGKCRSNEYDRVPTPNDKRNIKRLIESLPNLKELRFWNTCVNNLEWLREISNIENIISIEFQSCTIKDFKWIENICNLERIFIRNSGCDKAANKLSMAKLPKLIIFNSLWTNFGTWDCLKHMKQLREVEIYYWWLDIDKIMHVLKGKENLKEIFLYKQ